MQIDWWYVIIAFVLLLVCVKFIWSLIDWLFFEKLGIETRKMKQKRQDSELLRTTADLAKTTSELAKTTAQNLDKLHEIFKKSRNKFLRARPKYSESGHFVPFTLKNASSLLPNIT